MGDSEERTAYTPEEQNEIDRILGLLPGDSSAGRQAVETPPRPRIEPEDEMTLDMSDELVDIGESPASVPEEIEDITDIIEMVEEPPPREMADAGEMIFDEAPAVEALPETGGSGGGGVTLLRGRSGSAAPARGEESPFLARRARRADFPRTRIGRPPGNIRRPLRG